MTLPLKTLTHCPVCEIFSNESEFIISDYVEVDTDRLFYSVDLCKRCGAVYTKERTIYPDLYTKKYDPEKEHGFQSDILEPLSKNIWNYQNKMLQVEELSELLPLDLCAISPIEDESNEILLNELESNGSPSIEVDPTKPPSTESESTESESTESESTESESTESESTETSSTESESTESESTDDSQTPVSYLEIGSSDGSLFRLLNDYCIQNNIKINATLVESSGASQPCAQMENCNVISKSILDESIASLLWKVEMFSSLYDVAVISHCLEHFDNPREVLGIVHKIIKKNGVLYIEVPDGLRIDYSVALPLGYYHLVNYNVINLPWMINDAGFEIVDIVQRENQPGLRVIARKKKDIDLATLLPFDNTSYILGKSSIVQWNRRRNSVFAYLRGLFQTFNFDNSNADSDNVNFDNVNSDNVNSDNSSADNVNSQKILLYGAGTHTCSILKEFEGWINKNNIKITDLFEITDSNPRIKHLNTMPVITPDELKFEHYKYVIISSYAYQEEIFTKLISMGCPEDKIIKLYDWIFLWHR